MIRSSLLLAVCLAALGCSGSTDSGSGGYLGVSGETLDVYEAALRHQLEDFTRDGKYYLSIDDRDLPADLLDRLRRDWPNIQQASKGKKDKVFLIYSETLKWDGANAAVVRAGYWFPTEHAGQARFGDYRIVKKDGRG